MNKSCFHINGSDKTWALEKYSNFSNFICFRYVEKRESPFRLSVVYDFLSMAMAWPSGFKTSSSDVVPELLIRAPENLRQQMAASQTKKVEGQ